MNRDTRIAGRSDLDDDDDDDYDDDDEEDGDDDGNCDGYICPLNLEPYLARIKSCSRCE